MTLKKVFIVLFLIFTFVVVGTNVSAVDENTADQTEVVPTKGSLLDKRKETAAKEMEEKREALKDKMEVKRETIRERLEMKRKEASESMKLKLETFRENLQKIKDEKKQKLLERIQDKLTAVNKRKTDFMMSVLEKLNNVLSRLEEKIAKAKSGNINTALADSALANAKTKISQAETAVSTQAGKNYVASVVTETTLRSTVGQTVNQLETDLRAVHKLVVDAKQALMNAAKEVAKLRDKKTLLPTMTDEPTPEATAEGAEAP